MSAWETYHPDSATPWDWRRVVHLHRRAGFGATWKEVTRDLQAGPHAAVDQMLSGESRVSGQRPDFDEMSGVIGEAAVSSGDPNRLKAWWLFRTLFTSDPLREKMTLMWHNHFATSNLKIANLDLMRQQNELFRELGFRPFGELLASVVKHAAMLIWLDANSNRTGKPNENLARELMELFTLGIGNYTEVDVKEAARALTGWTAVKNQYKFDHERHDTGEKTILGASGKMKGDDLLKLLLVNRATSRRIAWRLSQCFFGEGVVDETAMEQLANGIRQNGLNIGWAVRTILNSRLFFSDANISSRVSSPVEFVVAAIRGLNAFEKPPSTLILAEWCTRMGQDLFNPPNVGGWNEGRNWLQSRSIIARSNFAASMVAGQLRAPTEPPTIRMKNSGQRLERLLLGRELSEADRSKILAQIKGSKDVNLQARHFVSLLLSHPLAQLT